MRIDVCMRTQWCREHIDEVEANCHLSKEAVRKVKKAAVFCAKYPAFTECPTNVLDEILKIKGLSALKAVLAETIPVLTRRKPDGSWVKERFSLPEIKKIISKHQLRAIVEEKPKKRGPKRKQKSSLPEALSKSRTLVEVVMDENTKTIASDMILLNYAVDEYEAMTTAFSWAAERIAKGRVIK